MSQPRRAAARRRSDGATRRSRAIRNAKRPVNLALGFGCAKLCAVAFWLRDETRESDEGIERWSVVARGDRRRLRCARVAGGRRGVFVQR
jgi:hypothetical protein